MVVAVASGRLGTPGRWGVYRDDALQLRTGVYHPAFKHRLVSVPCLDRGGGGMVAFNGVRFLSASPKGQQQPLSLTDHGLYTFKLRWLDTPSSAGIESERHTKRFDIVE